MHVNHVRTDTAFRNERIRQGIRRRSANPYREAVVCVPDLLGGPVVCHFDVIVDNLFISARS